jgi:hypothetical protein
MTTAVAAYLQAEWIKYAFTAEGMVSRPTAWVVHLHTADPTSTGTVAEVTDTAYVRQSATWTRASGQVNNTAAVTFPPANAGYTVTHISVWDGGSAHCLYVGALQFSKPLVAGDTLAFGVNEIALSVA